MRKLFWGCLAGGVAVAGGALGVMYHGCCHPDTLVGKYVRTASCIVTTGGAVPLVTEKVCTHSEGEAEEEGTSYSMPPIVEGEEEAVEPGPQQQQSGIVGPETAPITIHEEEPAPSALVPPEVSGGALRELPENGVEPQGLVPGHCPQEMPYCVDQKKVAEPAAENSTKPEEESFEEAEPGTGAREEGETTTFWQMILEMFKIEMPAWWSDPVEASVPMTTEPLAPENHSYHHHSGCPYSGHCPYTGRCAPTTPPVVEPPATPATPETKATPQTGDEEPSEDANLTALRQALKLRHRLSGEKIEVAPTHPEVDTMEFRPSDANLYDYKLAGPL
jgi:hypothetical protein